MSGLPLALHRLRCVLFPQAAARGSAQRRRFLRERQAAVGIQAAWRGAAARRSLTAVVSAAVRIQAAWRMAVQRRVFLRLRAIAVQCQALARRRAVQAAHSRLCGATIVVQTMWRGGVVRRQLAARCAAIVTLQAAWRRASGRQQYLQLRGASIVLQAAARRWAQRAAFLDLREAAIVLQARIARVVSMDETHTCLLLPVNMALCLVVQDPSKLRPSPNHIIAPWHLSRGFLSSRRFKSSSKSTFSCCAGTLARQGRQAARRSTARSHHGAAAMARPRCPAGARRTAHGGDGRADRVAGHIPATGVPRHPRSGHSGAAFVTASQAERVDSCTCCQPHLSPSPAPCSGRHLGSG